MKALVPSSDISLKLLYGCETVIVSAKVVPLFGVFDKRNLFLVTLEFARVIL